MQRITQVTRRDIFDLLSDGFDKPFGFEVLHYEYDLFGRMTSVEFLNRLYPLKNMPSYDSRYSNAEEDIYIHTITNPYDYPEGWLFNDDRFGLRNGDDEHLLDFLCEVFHPEVRNEKGYWRMFYDKINNLLRADNYEMYPKNQISGRDVYGWRDLTVNSFKILKVADISLLLQLFNQGGYVLNFNTDRFDDFTKNVVGVALCARYGLSKGKSLEQFVKDGTEQDVIKLFNALIEHNESLPEHVRKVKGIDVNNATYIKCKDILRKCSTESAILIEHAEELKKKFSSEYLNQEIDLMYKMQKDNPTEAIGKAKELIESCCETILEYKEITPDKEWKLNNYVDETMKLLKITPEHISDTAKEAKAIKAILGSLKGIATNIGIIRTAYGSGHGKSASYKGLQERHAKLAIGSSVTLVNFLWDSFERNSN